MNITWIHEWKKKGWRYRYRFIHAYIIYIFDNNMVLPLELIVCSFLVIEVVRGA